MCKFLCRLCQMHTCKYFFLHRVQNAEDAIVEVIKSMRTMWNLGHRHWDHFFLRVPTSPSNNIGRCIALSHKLQWYTIVYTWGPLVISQEWDNPPKPINTHSKQPTKTPKTKPTTFRKLLWVKNVLSGQHQPCRWIAILPAFSRIHSKSLYRLTVFWFIATRL